MTKLKGIAVIITIFFSAYLWGCLRKGGQKNNPATLESLAANEEIAGYLKSFQGRGALTDSSSATPALKALTHFRLPEDLAIDLVLSEPQITQPVEIGFDHRGRLWVVQYNQYPFPKGLKVTGVDNHMRFKFDKVPLPPPLGLKGADKITVFEDTDGNGSYDKATDVISGLNIATSVALGRGKVWVLSPPYLLAYPDPDGDGLPNGKPEVHLEGFGLEDTHALANGLAWGPDGWLYGGQGSTASANISSAVTKNVAFQGQAIWRYNPATREFEIFAEGGGNTFNTEIDSKGRIYSGNNNADRGPNFKQGANYPKSLGKHGPHTNPYTFGNLENMELTGVKQRFTHALIKYEGAALPPRYNEMMIAANPLLRFVQMAEFVPVGSTFANVDKEKILETDDKWFRPVAIKAGPDGAVYLADWYDSRLSHVDPRDTWDKATGRVYRIRAKDASLKSTPFDISKLSNDELIKLLSNPNKWYRQQAQRIFRDRNDVSIAPKLLSLLKNDRNPQTALEALWALDASGGIKEDALNIALKHTDPYVRLWAVRLIGDTKKASAGISSTLVSLASSEANAEVRSQLACSAKRLPGKVSFAILNNLILNHDDSADPDIPLLLWWALEAKAASDQELVVEFFSKPAIWQMKVVKDVILKRIMQRYVMAGTQADYKVCLRLFEKAPTEEDALILLSGLQEGLRGRNIIDLPADLVRKIQPYLAKSGEGGLVIGVRQGDKQSIDQALKVVGDPNGKLTERLAYIKVLGEVGEARAVPILLNVLVARQSSGALQQAALQSLRHFDREDIGQKVVNAYPDLLRADPDVRDAALSLFSSRPVWARQLMSSITDSRKIHKEDLSATMVRRLLLLKDKDLSDKIQAVWPEVKLSSSTEINQQIARASKAMKSGSGSIAKGKIMFTNLCGSCHQLFGQGGKIGPDLNAYDRGNFQELLLNIADPNAYIREGYVNYSVTTLSGQTLSGNMLEQNNRSITIQAMGEDPVTIGLDQVKEMVPLKVSLMPERILENVSDQEIRDLFAFIMQKNKE